MSDQLQMQTEIKATIELQLIHSELLNISRRLDLIASIIANNLLDDDLRVLAHNTAEYLKEPIDYLSQIN